MQKRCYAAARRTEALTEPLSRSKPSAAPPLPPQNVQVGKLIATVCQSIVSSRMPFIFFLFEINLLG